MDANFGLDQADSSVVLQSVLEAMSHGVVVANHRGEVVLINQIAQDLIGLGLAETNDTSWVETYGLFLPDRATPYPQEDLPLARAIRGQVLDDAEVFVQNRWVPDGVMLSVNARPLRDPSGAVQGGVVVMRNITKRHEYERALEQERYLFDTLMSNLPDAIYFKDAASRFTRINPYMLVRNGFASPDDVLGKTDFDIFVDEHAQAAYDDEQDIISTGHPIVGKEEKETWPDGRVSWVLTTKMPMFSVEGEVVGTFGMSRDITQLKQTEQQLERVADELRRSNNELDQFATIASHDLQEPLRKVKMFADMLALRFSDDFPEEARDYLNRMVAATTRMQSLIEDLLDYSRVSRKKKQFSPVDLSEIALAVVVDLEARIQETGGSVEVGTLPKIDADDTQMRQLFQNLLSNGLKYRRPESAPIVRVTATSVSNVGNTLNLNHDCTEACQLEVIDNGIGFAKENTERIFAPFERLHGRSQYDGQGMGLAVCRKIAERHGGTITAHGELGRGAKFTVLLPVTQPKDDLNS